MSKRITYRIESVIPIPLIEGIKQQEQSILVHYYDDAGLLQSAIFKLSDWNGKDKQKLLEDYKK